MDTAVDIVTDEPEFQLDPELEAEFTFAEVVAPTEDGDNRDAVASAEPTAKRLRKNALVWREVGRHDSHEEFFQFLTDTQASDCCGKRWITGEKHVGKSTHYLVKRCGMRAHGCEVKLRTDIINGVFITRQVSMYP